MSSHSVLYQHLRLDSTSVLPLSMDPLSPLPPMSLYRVGDEMCLHNPITLCNCPLCADIRVGYERTVYTTPEGQRFVTLCAIIYSPSIGIAPQPFTISYTTANDTAGTHIF